MPKLLWPWLLALVGCATVPPPAPFHSDRITVEVKGSGPDVVLVPGLGSSPRIWDATIAAVPGYRYHLIHVGGFAGAPAEANGEGPLLDPVAEEIARYLASSGVKRPALVGHSLGGLWSMLVAARRPDLPGRVMTIDMPPLLAPLIGGPGATPDSVRPFARQARDQILAAQDRLAKEQIAELVVGSAKDPAVRAQAVSHWLSSDPRVTSQGMYELFTADIRAELRRIEIPLTALWVVPERSPLKPHEAREFFQSTFANAPKARVLEVADSHHLIMFDQPERFRKELRTFLAGE